nr:hypothetical protein [uncultured Arsenicibacter sp.]
MKALFTTSLLFIGLLTSSFAQSVFNVPPLGSTQRQSTTANDYRYTTPTQPAPAARYQEGYYRSNGTYVQPHMKTESNNTNWDNYSTQGNTNPYTSQQGTRARDYSNDAYNYGQSQTIYTGPRGGQYYYNSNGNRVYVPKRSTSPF